MIPTIFPTLGDEVEAHLSGSGRPDFSRALARLYETRQGPGRKRHLAVALGLTAIAVLVAMLLDHANAPSQFAQAMPFRSAVIIACAAGALAVLRVPAGPWEWAAFGVPLVFQVALSARIGAAAPPQLVDRNIVLSMILYAVLCAVPPVPVRVTGVLATLWFWCFALTLFLAEGMAVFRHHLQALAVGGIALAIGACLSMRREAARRREFLQALNAELAASELRRVNAELVRLMNTDVLTGVANRRRFDTAMRKAWDADGGAGEAPIGLLLADIDHFKALNDFAGHAHGDACLQAVAGAIQSAVGDGAATLARWGGEEFVILAPGLAYADLETLGETVRKAVLALQIPHPASPGTFVTISVGGAWCGKAAPCDSPDGLLRKADRALYAAKAGGRNCVVLEKEERMFFFEKKNQKTFAYGARACGRAKE